MAKLYTPLDFEGGLQMFVLTNDVAGAQAFFVDELTMRIQLSGLPIDNDTKAVASLGRQVFGESVADLLIRKCVKVACANSSP